MRILWNTESIAPQWGALLFMERQWKLKSFISNLIFRDAQMSNCGTKLSDSRPLDA
jgi:hypothetical protein